MKKFERKSKDERRRVLLNKNHELSYTFNNKKLLEGDGFGSAVIGKSWEAIHRVIALMLALVFVLTTVVVGVNLVVRGANGTYTISDITNGNYAQGYVNGADNGLIVNKTISDNGDGTLKVTLEQYANENLKKTDVVLVLDMSGSMEKDVNSIASFDADEQIIIDNNDIVDATDFDWYLKPNNLSDLGYSGSYNPYHFINNAGINVALMKDERGYYYTVAGVRRSISNEELASYLEEGGWTSRQHIIYLTRVDAMKIAAVRFVDDIVATGYGANTYISIVTFSNSSQVRVDSIPLTDENVNYVKYKILTGLGSTGGGSILDNGLSYAYSILNRPENTTDNKAVITITDGAPGTNATFLTDLGIGSLSIYKKVDSDNERAANNAFVVANQLKSIDAEMYAVGIDSIPDLDDITLRYIQRTIAFIRYETVSDDTTEETVFSRYMQYLSSNYGNTTALKDTYSRQTETNEYYNSSNRLYQFDEMFQSIAEKISNSSVEGALDIKDIIADEFKLVDPSNLTAQANGLEVYTQKAEAGGTFSNTHNDLDPSVLTFNNNTITYPDYDFASTYVSTGARTKGDDTNYCGEKLVISFNIKPDTFGGEDLPTNATTSGIYSGEGGDETVLANYPVPTVTVGVDTDNPLDDTYANHLPGNPVQDKRIYLSQSLNVSDLLDFNNATAQADIDGVKNRHVNIVYTLTDSSGNQVGTYTVPAGETLENGAWAWESGVNSTITPQDDTEYMVSCTITNPSTSETVTTSTPVTAHVYVYKPTVIVKDSEESSATTVDLNDNIDSVSWKHNGSSADTDSMGNPPVLDYEFKVKDTESTLENDKYALNKTTDFIVSNVVANNTPITSGTTFDNLAVAPDSRTNGFRISLPKYDVTITNSIDGNFGNTGESFDINVTWTEDGVNKTHTFSMVGDGAQQVIRADANTSVIVNGHDTNRDDYVTTYDKTNVDTTGITVTENTSVTITQTRDDILIEGIGDDSSSANVILCALTGVAVVSAGAGVAYLYRKKDEFVE